MAETYSDEQVEAALDAYHQGGGSWRQNLNSHQLRDMRRALAAASVPAQPVLTPAQQAQGWVVKDQGGMLVKTVALRDPASTACDRKHFAERELAALDELVRHGWRWR